MDLFTLNFGGDSKRPVSSSSETHEGLSQEQIYQNHQPLNDKPFKTDYWLILLVPFLVFLFWAFRNNKKSFAVKNSESFPHIPCYKCKFYSENPYIKCAVNPTQALTQEACDCRDFEEYQDYETR